MAEFVQTMKDWRRMCQHMSNMFGDDSCDRCPLVGCAAIYEDAGEMDYADVKNKVAAWAAEHPGPVYPLWGEWLVSIGAARREPNGIPFQLANGDIVDPPYEIEVNLYDRIPADIAQKLGIEPKEG